MLMHKIHRKRLLAVAHTLMDLTERERKHFDMATWVSRHWKNGKTCGTVGCAVGTCLIKGTLPGLRLRFPHKFHGEPSYGGQTSWDAVNKYFGLSYSESQRLFSHGSYGTDVSPLQVASRIIEFVRSTEEDGDETE